MESIEIIKSVKLGCYTRVLWKTTNQVGTHTYEKYSSGVVRFLGNKDNLIKTSKSGADYLHLFLTNNPYHRATVVYFKDGVEISESEYYAFVERPQKEIDKCFSKHIEDIVLIKKAKKGN